MLNTNFGFAWKLGQYNISKGNSFFLGVSRDIKGAANFDDDGRSNAVDRLSLRFFVVEI